MRDGSFHVENNNFTYTFEEGTTKTKIKFDKFIINALPLQESPTSELFFIGTITIEFESTVTGDTYTITDKNVKEMQFSLKGNGTSTYNDKTQKIRILIPELVQSGTVNQTTQTTTKTNSGSVVEDKPVTRTWEINETYDNYVMSFVKPN